MMPRQSNPITSVFTFLDITPPAFIRPKDDILCSVDEETLFSFTPSDYESLWDRIRSGYQLHSTKNKRINTYINWYSRNQDYMERVSERAKRYLFHIVQELENKHMPLELALLPVVESAFDPFAYSHGRASGIWQFISATGRRYGLKQNWWYDGRRDIEASTQAAIHYLNDLNKRFHGDWLLALAAYNTGEGNVYKAIKRNRRRGRATDFWSLRLPRETRAYVPQLLALAQVIRDPAAYNLTLTEIPNQPYFVRTNINSQIDLAKAAELALIDIDELYHLNAGYNRWATDPQGSHHLLLPVAKAEAFKAKLNDIAQEERVAWNRYKVRPGDTLSLIAKRFNTNVSTLKKINKIRGTMISAGKPLLIPVAAQPADHYNYSAAQRRQRKQTNSRGAKGSTRVNYRVKPGDSLWKIANNYHVRIRDLARWNGMVPKDTLKNGQKLIIWSNNQQHNNPVNNSLIRKVAYRVRRGDSLARIAGKFDLSIKDILRWNTIKKKNYIHPGQSLTLFVDITR